MSGMPRLGATVAPTGTAFVVWAPLPVTVELAVDDRIVSMSSTAHGYHEAFVEGVMPGARYGYHLDGGPLRPDPASRWQPDGVHGASQVIDLAYAWTDEAWTGIEAQDLVIYELHVGTFTEAGTLDAVVPHLPALLDLGVSAIELMPVHQCPGARNWGYDGVGLFAVQHSYGGPCGLQRLVDAAHQLGMGVIVDVVYNHLGPEGNYLPLFGPYLTDRYSTPWGAAVNVDGPGSDEVRRYFIDNAVSWIDEFHVDGLRLDAVHAIVDNSASRFVEELTDAVHGAGDRLGRSVHVIAESADNDPRLTRHAEAGGAAMDGQWNDDFHHALRVSLTGDRSGYYADFSGVTDLARALEDGFVYGGRHSRHRGHRVGTSRWPAQLDRLVVFSQNHDQIGNRPMGERLSTLLPFEALQVAAAVTLLTPSIPLLFMGEEHGETAPFLFFIDHGDEALIEAVRRGRQAEFDSYQLLAEPADPYAIDTFERSRIDHSSVNREPHATLRRFYRSVLDLRRDVIRAGQWQTCRDVSVDGCLSFTVGSVRVHATFDADATIVSDPGRVLLDSRAAEWDAHRTVERRVVWDQHGAHMPAFTVVVTDSTSRDAAPR